MNSQVTHWLARDPDPKTRQELQQLIDTQQDAQIAERFQSRLEFGTAGCVAKSAVALTE